MTPLGRSGLIKRLTGVNLEATRQFLLQDCFVPGKGQGPQNLIVLLSYPALQRWAIIG